MPEEAAVARLSLDERPRPLKDAAARITAVLGFLGTLVGAAAGWGLLTVAQGDAVQGLLGLLAGIVPAVFTALAAFGVVRAGEPQVTPLSDPRDNAGKPLRS
jgi:hypothetical protein